MGLFDFFRRPKAPEVLHPVFGRIVYADRDTWEGGRARFAPVGHDVEVIITAGAGGPTPDHLRYWRALAERWPEIRAHSEPLLRSTLTDWIPDADKRDIWARLDVETLDVFSGDPPAEWELAFWCEEASHWPTIGMRHWTPVQCFIDG